MIEYFTTPAAAANIPAVNNLTYQMGSATTIMPKVSHNYFLIILLYLLILFIEELPNRLNNPKVLFPQEEGLEDTKKTLSHPFSYALPVADVK
jgi:hypothetical protein